MTISLFLGAANATAAFTIVADIIKWGRWPRRAMKLEIPGPKGMDRQYVFCIVRQLIERSCDEV